MSDVSCEQDRDRIPDLLARRAAEHLNGAAGTLLALSCRIDLIVDHRNAEGSASHTRPRRALQTYPAFDRMIQQFGSADSPSAVLAREFTADAFEDSCRRKNFEKQNASTPRSNSRDPYSETGTPTDRYGLFERWA